MRFVQRVCIARVYRNNVMYQKGKFINMLHDTIRATDVRKSVIFGPLTYHVMTAVKYLLCSQTLVSPNIWLLSLDLSTEFEFRRVLFCKNHFLISLLFAGQNIIYDI